MIPARSRALGDHVPPLVFTFIYVVTCVVGALFLVVRIPRS